MKKKGIFILYLLLITLVGCAVPPPKVAISQRFEKQVTEKIRNKEVYTVSEHASLRQKGTIGLGTRFFYNSNGDFLTNRHVVSECRPGGIRARTSDGVWHTVELLAVDAQADIAAGSIKKSVDAFASIRAQGSTGYVSVPEATEDIFSAGFSAPDQNRFTLQTKWGQIQSWSDPNERPFVQRMRMDAFPGASGSPILDYGGLLVGILFAGSEYPAPDYNSLRAAGYGDKWIFFYNNNAIVEFANKAKLSYSAWGEWERKDPEFIAGHARRITVLLACETKDAT